MEPTPQEDEMQTPDHAYEEQESDSEAGSSAVGFVIRSDKKSPYSQIFSNDDVIRLLTSLVVFWSNGKKNKWVEFHQFVKNDLSKEFTKTQIQEKIRSLRDKFERARENGARNDQSDPHESAVFELSEALWGDEDMNKGDEAYKKRRKKKMKRIHHEEKMEIGLDGFKSAYPNLYESFHMFGCPKFAIEECVLIGREKAEQLEEQWKELKAERLQLELKKLQNKLS